MTLMDDNLAGRLERSGVRVVTRDEDSVRLQDVPLDARLFSKDRTNLLLRRLPAGAAVLAVDHDLEYLGPDASLAKAFAAARRRQNWRVLTLPGSFGENAGSLAAAALALIGYCRPEAAAAERDDGLLARLGVDPSTDCGAVTVGRREEIHRVVAAVRAWQGRLALVAGASGSGKTHLLGAAARALAGPRPLRVVSIDLAVLMAGAVLESGREELLGRLLDEAGRADDLALALENIDRGVMRAPGGHALIASALDGGVRLIGTALPENLPALLAAPLARRIEVIELRELSPAASMEVLQAYAGAIAGCHRVRIEAGVLEAAVARSHVVAGALPARALTLLDAAAGRAAAVGAEAVEAMHVYLAASDWPDLRPGPHVQEGA